MCLPLNEAKRKPDVQNEIFIWSPSILGWPVAEKHNMYALHAFWFPSWNKMNRALCTYRLNWARRISWGWWDDWDDTVLQTQDSKFEPWRSEAEHATSRSRRLPTIVTFTRGWGTNIFCFFQTAETGNRTPNSGVKGSGASHYPEAPARFPSWEKWHPLSIQRHSLPRGRWWYHLSSSSSRVEQV